ncbi:MAG TPA: globin family protein [Terriglobia bacterium]|nr:globin family protein [Terriglobia bacterium]
MTANTADMAGTITLVQASWVKVKSIGSEAATLFYQNLFISNPELRPLFKGDLRQQGVRLMQMLDFAIGKLTDLDTLAPVLQKLGQRHGGYGVKPAHYDLVGAALLQTLEQGLGRDFTDETRAAWSTVYGLVARTMMAGSAG